MFRVTTKGQNRLRWPVLLLSGLVATLAGCSSAHYRKSADTEVYRIIEEYDRAVFGHTNSFSIDTPYSGRDPKSVLPAELIEDRQATNRRLINVEEALRLAKTYSREYQTQREQLYLSALSLTGTRYAFSPQFFAESTASISGTGDTAQSGSVRSSVGVSQLLKSGGRLSLALGNDLVRIFTARFSGGDSPVALGNDSAINLLSVNLTQPLLRGFGRNDPTVEALTQAERNVVYAIRSFSLYQNQFAANTVSAYFALLGQKRNVRNNYTNYLRRVETREYVEARSVDRESRSRVDEMRNSELSAQIGYVNSVANYLNALDAFKIRLGLPITEVLALADADLGQLEQAGLIRVDISQEAAFRMAVEKHMDLLNAIDRFEDSKRKVRVAADQLRTGLNFTGNANWQSEEPYDYTNFDFDKLRWSAGLSLDLPVDRLRERNTYRSTLISFESQLRSLVTTLDNSRDRIETGLRNLERERLNYVSRQEALRVAERRADNDQLLFRAGRLQIINLRQSQDDLIAAQNSLTDAIVAYQNNRLSLLLDLGLLIAERDRFWLSDPLAGVLLDSQRGRPPLEMPEDKLIPPDQFLEPVL
ncbi:MAG: TolC family protein [Verrucomicrobiales bacterium]|nr:TolC family protein [Verrucomicrobiales bacterium]